MEPLLWSVLHCIADVILPSPPAVALPPAHFHPFAPDDRPRGGTLMSQPPGAVHSSWRVARATTLSSTHRGRPSRAPRENLHAEYRHCEEMKRVSVEDDEAIPHHSVRAMIQAH